MPLSRVQPAVVFISIPAMPHCWAPRYDATEEDMATEQSFSGFLHDKISRSMRDAVSIFTVGMFLYLSVSSRCLALIDSIRS